MILVEMADYQRSRLPSSGRLGVQVRCTARRLNLGFSSMYTIPERRKKGLEKPEEFPDTILLGTSVFWEFPYTTCGGAVDPPTTRFGARRIRTWDGGALPLMRRSRRLAASSPSS